MMFMTGNQTSLHAVLSLAIAHRPITWCLRSTKSKDGTQYARVYSYRQICVLFVTHALFAYVLSLRYLSKLNSDTVQQPF